MTPSPRRQALRPPGNAHRKAKQVEASFEDCSEIAEVQDNMDKGVHEPKSQHVPILLRS